MKFCKGATTTEGRAGGRLASNEVKRGKCMHALASRPRSSCAPQLTRNGKVRHVRTSTDTNRGDTGLPQECKTSGENSRCSRLNTHTETSTSNTSRRGNHQGGEPGHTHTYIHKRLEKAHSQLRLHWFQSSRRYAKQLPMTILLPCSNMYTL